MADTNRMKRICCVLTLLALWLTTNQLSAQPSCKVHIYDETDGLPSAHVTQVLQDEQGLMWFATWNGLCRYDGYDFQTFKPQAGDGCNMTTDRIHMFAMRPDGNFVCRTEDGYFLFDTRTYRFSNLPKRTAEEDLKHYRTSMSLKEDRPIEWKDAYDTRWTLYVNGRLTYQRDDGLTGDYPLDIELNKLSFAFQDRQGNLWVMGRSNGIYKFTTDMQRTRRLPIEPQAQVRCLFKDNSQRLWVATREDGAVRLYDAKSMQLSGYLGADGRLHQQYTRFGAVVYCMYQSMDGTLWLGTKPKGIYRLKETAAGTFHIDHLTQLPNLNVYNILEDRQGRLWVATLGGGLCYAQQPQAANPQFVVPKGYPKDAAQRVRYLMVEEKQQVLLAATTEGLIVSRLEPQADRMIFRLHQREADRTQSLSSSGMMDIIKAHNGRLYVSTESGGVNLIEDADLLKEQLTFRHYTVQNHMLPSDVVMSMTPMPNGRCAIVSSHLVSIIDSTTQYRQLDTHYFNADYRFSEARPLMVDNDTWIFGLNDGAFLTTTRQMERQTYQPQMVLTCLEVRGERSEVRGEKQVSEWWNIERMDTLTLQPHERNITLHFAAIDYQAPERISYAFRLMTDGQRDTTQWNYIGTNRSVTLLNLEPGTYRLEVRSTNADGVWMNNQRVLTLIVKPTFWEAWYGKLLLVLLIAGFVAAVICTLLYIRRIKRQHCETLEKYLSLIEVSGERSEVSGERLEVSGEESQDSGESLDPMLQRVMQFVDENIANSDVNVGDMASAAAVSRSGLQRKVKQAMGITPQDLLRKARIKRACQLLRQTDKTVAEVAYACGFSDPKYFSRSFKQSTGLSPTEYKTQA